MTQARLSNAAADIHLQAEEEEALNPGVVRKHLKTWGLSSASAGHSTPSRPHQGPGPHQGDEFEDVTAFREAVDRHSQLVNPGSLLLLRRPNVNNVQLECRNSHTGCRYEFYAALHPPAEDDIRRVTVTDVS